MKQSSPKAEFTFGDLIVGIYGSCERRRAAALLRFAVNAGLVSIPRAGNRRVLPRVEGRVPVDAPVRTGKADATQMAGVTGR